MKLYLLYESAAGYALFKKEEFDEVAPLDKEFQKAIGSFGSLSKVLQIEALTLFSNAEKALANSKAIANSQISEELQSFLEQYLPKYNAKKPKYVLGVQDKALGVAILEKFGIACKAGSAIYELFRGIRAHFDKFLKGSTEGGLEVEKTHLGLAHSFSRDKIQYDVHREDKPITQSLALIEIMDKNINLLSMRAKEWYSWHFPELVKVVSDNKTFVQLINLIGNRDSISEASIPEIEEVVLDGEMAQAVFEAARSSMGQELSEMDEAELKLLCERILNHIAYREELQSYLQDKMEHVSPNLMALTGEHVGAKLISHAGGLQNLAKYPASTIQILGAEKALFRALKTKGNTPKYGLLYNSSFIGKARGPDKGKISRYLANKCAIAARLDYFLKKPTNAFGERLRLQVESRLRNLESGEEVAKNGDVMEEVMNELKQENLYVDDMITQKPPKKSKKEKKAKKEKMEVEEDDEAEETVKEKKKKAKKEKKKAKMEVEEDQEIEEAEIKQSKKKKKKSG